MFKARQKIKRIITDYLKEIEKLGIKPERVVLYGSFAKGNPREYSDIDLLIISKDFRNMNLRQRLEVLGIASARIRQPIEAYGCTPSEVAKVGERSFLKEVLTTGLIFS